MPKRHLFVMDPIDKINPSTDSTFDLMLECQSRGHEVSECQISDLFLMDETGNALTRRIMLHDDDGSGQVQYDAGLKERKAFKEFECIWMRKDPPVDDNFIAALQMLNCHKKSETRLINDTDGLLVANEKLWPLTIAPEFMPQTVVSADPTLLYEAAQAFERAVVKPLFQSGGSGVMVFHANDKNLKAAIDLLTEQGRKPAMLQKFIDKAELGDKRIILAGGKPIGAMLRVPSETDHRANLHVGGNAVKTELSEREHEICKHLEPYLLANGLYFVGIDVINGFLTEVNVTSPTGLQEIDRLNEKTGRSRLRAQLLDWIEENLL